MVRHFADPGVISDSYFPSYHFESAFGVELYRLGINPVFLQQDPLLQGIGRIVIQHGNHGLRDYRPRIDALVGKMDGTAGELDTILEGTFLGMYSLK